MASEVDNFVLYEPSSEQQLYKEKSYLLQFTPFLRYFLGGVLGDIPPPENSENPQSVGLTRSLSQLNVADGHPQGCKYLVSSSRSQQMKILISYTMSPIDELLHSLQCFGSP